MKPATLRRSGRHMLTVSIKFHLGLDEAAAACALRQAWPTERVGKATVNRFLRDVLSTNSDSIYWASEHFDGYDPDTDTTVEYDTAHQAWRIKLVHLGIYPKEEL